MQLRPYQVECKEIVDALPEGSKSIVAIATGLGKTVVGASFNCEGRMLWLSHRDELVRQPEKYFVAEGKSFGIEKADEHSSGEDVVSASIQSISRDARLESFDPDAFEMVIVDECHHALAPTYQKVINYFHPKKLIGLTATPNRGDGQGLGKIFDDICFIRDLKWGIENKYLSRIRCAQLYANYDLNRVQKVMGEFTASGLSDEMAKSDDDIVVTKAYLTHCLPEKRQTLIYCPTVNVCRMVMATLRAALPESERDTVAMLYDGIDADERRSILEKYQKGEIRCIINCMILTEGTDLPTTSAIIINRPTANGTLYQQIVGRGTRLSKGKEYCLVIDILPQGMERKGVFTAPSLFGVDLEQIPKKMQEKMQEKDLLEFTDAISKERAAVATEAELMEQMVDIFTQERLDVITKNVGKGLKAVAAAYEQKMREDTVVEGEDGNDKDVFMGMFVKHTPSQDRYYCIEATFEDRIYISKPDLLDKVILEFDCANIMVPGYGPACAISDRIPMKQAVAMAKAFLLLFACEPWYMQKWDAACRISTAAAPATEKQQGRIWHEFNNMGYSKKVSGLTKLEASNLIDLTCELQSLAARKKAVAAAKADAAKKRSGKILLKWQEKQELMKQAEEADRAKRKAGFPRFEKVVWLLFEKEIEKQKKREATESQKQGGTLKIPINLRYFFARTKRPSDKQMAFFAALVEKAKASGMVFDADPVPLATVLDQWQFGLAIDCMKALLELPRVSVPGSRRVCEISKFLKKAKDTTGMESKNYIPCDYKLESKE